MRIALVNLTGGGLSGGCLTYLRNMVPRLSADSRIAALEVHVPAAARDLELGNGVRLWSAAEMRLGAPRLRQKLRALDPDVVFVPNSRYVRVGAPVVCMVRNMEPLIAPIGGNPPLEAAKNLLRAHVTRTACQRSDHVIAVSGFVREYLEGRWAVPPDKISVIYHGVRATAIPAERPAALAAVRPGEFLFTAGSIRPYRGLGDLVGGLATLKRSGLQPPLVIAGMTDATSARCRREVESAAVAAGVADQLVWAGRLGLSEMAWAYANCAACVVTSRVEACPNAVLEAMSYGCVCISNDAPPMPEFFGDIALYYPTGDAQALGGALREGLTVDVLERKRRSRQRSLEFSWEHTVHQTISVLQRVADSSGRRRRSATARGRGA